MPDPTPVYRQVKVIETTLYREVSNMVRCHEDGDEKGFERAADAALKAIEDLERLRR